MKNILGNKHKRYYRKTVFRYYRAGFILCFIIMSFILSVIYSSKITPLEPLKQTETVEVVSDTTQEKNVNEISWNDAIRELFPKDEAGLMIRICMAENKAQSKTAMNTNDNGSYDYSWCQINSIHKPKSMSHSDWLANLENPRFHAKEVRRIYLSQGYNAWTVYKKGLVN